MLYYIMSLGGARKPHSAVVEEFAAKRQSDFPIVRSAQVRAYGDRAVLKHRNSLQKEPMPCRL